MVEKRKRFQAIYPDKYFADKGDLVSMAEYLRNIDFLKIDEKIISAEVPGAGNMNYVLRIKTDMRSFILKQSRPWVEKYPSIDAPIDRINIEALFYDSLQGIDDLEKHSPQLYFVDADNYVILMEDLGDIVDFAYMYSGPRSEISDKDIISLTNFLNSLHSVNTKGFPDNMEMRILNHEHIFNYPYDSNNGFDLNSIQSGLSDLAVNEITDPELVQLIRETGQLYLRKNGSTLLHGDFYPGSWMKSDQVFVLDAEFCFIGPAEFELGVFIAHMKMAQQSDDKIELILSEYKPSSKFDLSLTYRFAGIEILRRLLGVAQLPLKLNLIEKAELIDQAKSWISKEVTAALPLESM